MKKLLIACALVALAVVANTSATPQASRINVFTVNVGVRHVDVGNRSSSVGDTTTWVKLVQAREAGPPIGHLVLICTFAGKGGSLGSGLADCAGVLKMPLGKIRVSGQRRNRFRYYLPVTGGTGRYQGLNGVYRAVSIGPRREMVTVVLN